MHRISNLAEPATLQIRRVLATRRWPSQEETLEYVALQLNSTDQFLIRLFSQLDAYLSKVSGAGVYCNAATKVHPLPKVLRRCVSYKYV